MSAHMTDKDIDNYVSGLASAKDVKAAEEHLSSCPQCSMTVRLLSSAVAVQPAESEPGGHVRDAVLSEWHRIHNEIAVKNTEEAKTAPRLKKIVAGLAIAASVIIAVSSYLLFSTFRIEESYPLAITSATGELYINSRSADKNYQVKTGDFINTGAGSSAVVSTESYDLYIGKSSSLKLTENNRKDGILFILNDGYIISRSSGPVRYSFACGPYRIIPAGTEFMLKYSEDKLDASVLQGKIQVSGKEFQTEIPAGMKWSSVRPDRVEILDTESSLIIKSGFSGEQPPDRPSSDKNERKPEKKDTGTGKPGDDGIKKSDDSSIGKNNQPEDKKEKMEKVRLNRELREEMNDIKKEQKKEQRREKNGRNN